MSQYYDCMMALVKLIKNIYIKNGCDLAINHIKVQRECGVFTVVVRL